MTPRPVFNPHPLSSIPYDVARRMFDAELAAWAAETMVTAVERFEAAIRGNARPAIERFEELPADERKRIAEEFGRRRR